MTWGAENRAAQRARARTLSGNLAGQEGVAGLPQGDHTERGSRGGAPIWVAAPAFVPPSHWKSSPAADPDGFAVFGRYPKGFLAHVLKLQLVGPVRRDQVLHVCSGTLSESEAWTVDLRPQAKPRVIADGRALPFRDGAFAAVKRRRASCDPVAASASCTSRCRSRRRVAGWSRSTASARASGFGSGR